MAATVLNNDTVEFLLYGQDASIIDTISVSAQNAWINGKANLGIALYRTIENSENFLIHAFDDYESTPIPNSDNRMIKCKPMKNSDFLGFMGMTEGQIPIYDDKTLGPFDINQVAELLEQIILLDAIIEEFEMQAMGLLPHDEGILKKAQKLRALLQSPNNLKLPSSLKSAIITLNEANRDFIQQFERRTQAATILAFPHSHRS